MEMTNSGVRLRLSYMFLSDPRTPIDFHFQSLTVWERGPFVPGGGYGDFVFSYGIVKDFAM